MGHTSADACNVGVTDAVVDGQGIQANRMNDVARNPAPRQAVRRGAVRAPSAQVGPSRWEHVELDFDGGSQASRERVSTLVLEAGCGPDPGGSFWAAAGAFRQVDDRSSGEEITRGAECFAGGSWKPCRGGVELIFAETPELGLPELTVRYRVRTECLVADDASLPDGLVQEYSRCSTTEAAVPAQQLAIGNVVGGQESSSGDIDGNSGGPPIGHSGVLPAGIIEDGASSDDEDFSDLGDDCIVVTAHAGVGARLVKENKRDQLVEEDESYPEDFELEDEDEEEDEP